MKIGIITWFSGTNYGTHIQAIALQAFLRKMQYDVEIINYEVDVPQKRSFVKRVLSQPQKYIDLYAYKKFDSQIKLRDEKLKSIIKKCCILTSQIRNDDEFVDICNRFDLLICGGDQIWNPNWYHRFYYADYDNITTRRISYAPSIGVDEIPVSQINNIVRSLNKFDYISVRERKSVDVISNLFPEKNVTSVIDPVFLLDESEWSEIFDVQNFDNDNRYVLSMFMTDNVHHWKAAKRFANENSYKHVIIPYCGYSYLQTADIVADAGLEDVVNLIKNADYVLTDSFHITVLALIFKKSFYTFQRFKEDRFSSTNERVKNLLSIVDCENRFLSYGTKYIKDVDEIDYKIIQSKLNEKVEESKQFLKVAIGEK